MSETDKQNQLRIDLSDRGITNWRNNTGALPDKNGRLVRYGLCTGSSDIIAITPIVITPEMVGSTIGVFTAIEVKVKNRKPSKAQKNFIRVIKEKGGFAGVARCFDDLKEIISLGRFFDDD